MFARRAQLIKFGGKGGKCARESIHIRVFPKESRSNINSGLISESTPAGTIVPSANYPSRSRSQFRLRHSTGIVGRIAGARNVSVGRYTSMSDILIRRSFIGRGFSTFSTAHPTCNQMEVYGPGFYFNAARETPVWGSRAAG